MNGAGPVAVLGLGLIGGSLARDLASQGATVWGFDTDDATLRRAGRAGVISARIDADLTALREVETVVLAVPVDVAPALLERARPFLCDAALITDVGSTKQRIMRQAAALGLSASFVGGHPMAGDHRAGWSASRRGLFAGARVALCRSSDTHPAAWRRARALWRRLGARPTERDAASHDAELAFSSHLPQLLSLALAGALSARAIARDRLGPAGHQMTRLAASSPEMWAAILDDNAVPILDAVDSCTAALAALRRAVTHHDRRAIIEAFTAAQCWMAEREVGSLKATRRTATTRNAATRKTATRKAESGAARERPATRGGHPPIRRTPPARVLQA